MNFFHISTKTRKKQPCYLRFLPVCGTVAHGDIMKKQIKSSLFLLSGTVIWGAAFVAQRSGMAHIGPFTFQAIRCGLGCAFLLLLSLFTGNRQSAAAGWRSRQLWLAGILCGSALFVAAGLQQVGLQYTAAGKAGFLTAMYIVIVPLKDLFTRKRLPLTLWISVAMSVGGLYLLSCVGITEINPGDLLLAGCAVAFALQILLIDRFAPGLDAIKFNALQSGVCAALSAVLMVFESPTVSGITAAWLPLCYTGVLSTGVAYTFQIIGQRNLHPAVASLIMSMESVFAALSGWLLLREQMSTPELWGCALVFGAVLLSQVPAKKIP